MGKITFVLKEPDTGKNTPVLVLYTCHNGRLKYYTGESATNLTNLNKGTKAILSRIETHIDQTAVDYKIKGEPLLKQTLKASLDNILNKRSKQVPGNTFETMARVIDKMETGQLLTPAKKRYAKGSIKTFRFTVELLKRFNPALTLQSTGIETYHQFIWWMQSKDYSTNYIGSQIKNWKTLGKAIGGKGFEQFKKIKEETFDIYLDEKEIAAMYRLKLSGRETVVRDWFVLDCYTGLRVSDLVLLSKRNYSKGFITIANEKTDQRVIIPAHKFVKEILSKYDGFPPLVTDVEINRVIKGVAMKANITSEVLFTITKGGVRVDEYLQKWQMVSCHTCRRSFITNLLKNGVPDSVVMKLTGIKSSQTLKRYDKLGEDEAAKIAAKHKFFR